MREPGSEIVRKLIKIAQGRSGLSPTMTPMDETPAVKAMSDGRFLNKWSITYIKRADYEQNPEGL